MKQIQTALKYLAAIALTVLGAGCATDMQEKENLAAAAGFKQITPTKPDHVALLPKLPKGKVTQVNYGGKTYYVLPDAANNRAWVGGPKQYQAYQQLRLAKQISNDNLMAAQMNEAAAMNWGGWGGWGAWGGMSPYGMGPGGWY